MAKLSNVGDDRESVGLPPERFRELVDGLKELMSSSFELKRTKHATFSDGSELNEWQIKGAIEGKNVELNIEMPYLDFHFFVFQIGSELSAELIGSAPLFQVPIRQYTISGTPSFIKDLKRLFSFLSREIEPSFSEHAWRLYSSKEYLQFCNFIKPYLKKISLLRGRAFFTLWAACAAQKARLKEAATLYEKAATLLGLLSLPWFSYFCLQQRLGIKKPLTEDVMEEMRALGIGDVEVPQDLLVPSSQFDYDTYRTLLESASGARTNDEKKRTLEKLAAFLLNSIDGSISTLPNIRTTTEEMDLLLKNESTDPFWQRMGSPILVECKNWSKPVGPDVLRDLKGKMEIHGVRVGILLSLGRVTRGVKEYLKSQRIIGHMIIVIDKKDLSDIASARITPAQKISEKYYWLYTI